MVGMEYSRANNAIVMALGEINQLRQFLKRRAQELREEADQIDKFLRELPEEAKSWYGVIRAEYDQERATDETRTQGAAR